MLHSLQKLQRHVVLLCLYGMLSRIIVLNDAQRSLFAESDDKGKAKVWNRQAFTQIFFTPFYNFFSTILILNDL